MADKYFLVAVEVEKYLGANLSTDNLITNLKSLQKFGTVTEYNTLEEMALKLKLQNQVVKEVIPSEVKVIYELIDKIVAEKLQVMNQDNEKLKLQLKRKDEMYTKIKSFLSTIGE